MDPQTQRTHSGGSISPGEEKRRRSVGFSYVGLNENACKPLSRFPEKPPEGLLCDIGKGVMTDPVCNQECGHQYCKKCIEELLETSQQCPAKGCVVDVHEDALLSLYKKSKEVASLVAYCTNKARGCQWVGVQCELEDHLKTCKRYLPITCEMCKQKVPRKQMAAHAAANCPKLPAVCPDCHEDVLAVHLKHHMEHECGKAPPPVSPPVSPPETDLSESLELVAGIGSIRVKPYDPRASPRGSILRKAAWGEDNINIHKTNSSLSIDSDGAVPKNKEANDCGDSRRLGRRKKGNMSPSPSFRSEPPGTSDLWSQIEQAKIHIEHGGEPDLALLLTAITTLQSRVRVLEAENDNLRSRTPFSSSPSPQPSPSSILAPLRLNASLK
eukprot:TRINITY_DN8874_c5_g1_i1.p1 TRINITY_DN8874_c5_g1~~TRINITY_DN8874_c5_g1_i1.p1  ORF type:complete len:407 (+),score=65.31 TRINITY_DN8874_c5_g1_i1:71-1222(+)